MKSIVDGNIKDASLVMLGMALAITVLFTLGISLFSFIILPLLMKYILPPIIRFLYYHFIGGG